MRTCLTAKVIHTIRFYIQQRIYVNKTGIFSKLSAQRTSTVRVLMKRANNNIDALAALIIELNVKRGEHHQGVVTNRRNNEQVN